MSTGEYEEHDEAESTNLRKEWLKHRFEMSPAEVDRRIFSFIEREKDFIPRSRFLVDPAVSQMTADEDIIPVPPIGVPQSLNVEPFETPDTLGRPEWGVSRRSVRVSSKRAFEAAILRIRLQGNDQALMEPSSILLARWEPRTKRLLPVPASGFNRDGQYAFARVTRDGIYTVMGIPNDPKALRFLLALHTAKEALDKSDQEITPEGSDGFERMVSSLRAGVIPTPTMVSALDPTGTLSALLIDDRQSASNGVSLERLKLALNRIPSLFLMSAIVEPQLLLEKPNAFPEIFPNRSFPPKHVGPSTFAGRVTAVVCHPRNIGEWYAATAGGGVWRTIDSGVSWRPTMDDPALKCIAIGGMDISQSDPECIFAATGDWTGGVGNGLSVRSQGIGVYRSGDGAQTWQLCGPVSMKYASVVRIDPRDCDHVYVGGDGGLYESTNGGICWRQVDIDGASLNEISDLMIDPLHPDTVYVGCHLRGVFKRSGKTEQWQPLNLIHGLGNYSGQNCIAPKIAICGALCSSTRKLVLKIRDDVFFYSEGKDGLVPSDNRPSGHRSSQMYSSASFIAGHPIDADVVVSGDYNLNVLNIESGVWRAISTANPDGFHRDQQSLVFLPPDHEAFLVSNDRGVFQGKLNDLKKGQDKLVIVSTGVVAAQFFDVSISIDSSAVLAGAIMDTNAQLQTGETWIPLNQGEGGQVVLYPQIPGMALHWTWEASLRWIKFNGERSLPLFDTSVVVPRLIVEPVVVAAIGPGRVYSIAANQTGDGRLITDLIGFVPDIAPDLIEYASIQKILVQSGAEVPSGNWYVLLDGSSGDSFTAIGVSPSIENVLYAGTDNGTVWHSNNCGRSWRGFSPSSEDDAPTSIKTIVVDWHQESRFFVTALDRRGNWAVFRGDLQTDGIPRIHWTRLTAFDAIDVALTGLVIHPQYEGVLYVATVAGVFESRDGGGYWFAKGIPMPPVPTIDIDLAIDRTGIVYLASATFGRGICIQRVS